MKKIDELLEELGLEELIHSEFYPEIRLYSVHRGEVGDIYGYSTGVAWYLVKGWIKGNTYFKEDAILSWDVREGQWFGFLDAVLGTFHAYDLKAMGDSDILEIPLTKIFKSENTSPELLRELMWHMAMTKRKDDENAIARLGLSDEGFFLKYLETNDFYLTYGSQQEISSILNINTRTFQRILRSLESCGIICKKRGALQVRDREKFYAYIEDKQLWKGK